MDVAEFLSLVELPPGSSRYVLGPFDPGVTLLRQQTRALNLLYALRESGRLAKQNTKVAVIGGGVAGLTAAIAAAKLGCKVTVLERRHSLLHLQQGCDTRWLHPHIYDWPVAGSQREYAGLPLLDWRAASAARVARQILAAFDAAPERSKISIALGATLHPTPTGGNGSGPRLSWESTNPKASKQQSFDVVILAVGFGFERQVSQRWPAYWRNDSIHQIDPRLPPSAKTKVLISGTGDGGLIDLMRTTLADFDHSRIHDDLFQSSTRELFAQLNDIRREWPARPKEDTSWLCQRFDELEQDGLLKNAIDIIQKRMRPDTDVTLNGTPTNFYDAIQLDKASMFSALVSFCLNNCRAFQYKPGTLSIDDQSTKLHGELVVFDHVLVRHGADTAANFRDAHCQEVEQILASPDGIRKYFNTAKRLWPVNWWSKETRGTEPVSPPTVMLATTFVSTLRDMVRLSHDARRVQRSEPTKFRMTLHRVIRVQSRLYYQQIARYASSGQDEHGATGRTFDVDRGLGGLCCRVGRPVILKKGAGFEEVRAALELNLTPARPIANSTESFLAVPFFASQLEPNSSSPQVTLLLYADSNRSDFFDEQILSTIYTACKGLVTNLEMMIGHREIALSAPDFEIDGCKANRTDDQLLEDHRGILVVDEEKFAGYADHLTFKSIRFFEIAQGINHLDPLF